MTTVAQTCALGILANPQYEIRNTRYEIRYTQYEIKYAKQTQFTGCPNERK